MYHQGTVSVVTKVLMTTPRIDIRYAWFLDPVYHLAFEARTRDRKGKYPAPAQIVKQVERYRRAWKRKEMLLLQAMQKVLHMSFSHNWIDVYIIGRGQSISNPVVISSRREPEEFVDVLTHELIHRLLAENREEVDFLRIVNRRFKSESRSTKIHIAVHAVHYFLYLDVLNAPHRLKRDVEYCKALPHAYSRSWQIVQEAGYKSIIDLLREPTQKMWPPAGRKKPPANDAGGGS